MNEGEKFLHQRNPKLHTSNEVEHELQRRKIAEEQVSQKPVDKISNWMKVLERTHLSHRDNEKVIERLKKYYYDRYVIKEEDIPESYFVNQQEQARELGHGNIEITERVKQEAYNIISADQKSTLDNWFDYLISEDTDMYPIWAKYWAFKGMLDLSKYNKEKKVFARRDKTTVAPFVDLNREALAYVMDIIIKKVNSLRQLADGEREINNNDEEFLKLLQGANFGKLYSYAIEKITPTEESELAITDGEWIKYKQGTDHMPLVESLQGYGTGWCTAGESTAKTHLSYGDFYVYYSKNKEGKIKIPRIAIRMEENKIAEVRGVANNQNVDEYITGTNILNDKLNEFGKEAESYKKKDSDMKELTKIEKKIKKGEDLTKEELRFLYEIDNKIEGFGYNRDPRIDEIINGREIKKDLANVFECREDEISITHADALKGGIKYHYGNLNVINLTKAEEGLVFPESIGGNLDLRSLTTAEGLVF